MSDFLQQEYYGNTIEHYLIALGIMAGGILIIKIIRKRLLRRVKIWSQKTETKLDDYLVRGLEKFGLPIMNFGVIYSSLSYLVIPERGQVIIGYAFTFIVTFYAVRMLTSFIRLMLESFTANKEDKRKQLDGIMLIVSAIIWGIGFLFLFDNMGYDITAIIAGLGIGGIAIALAAQNILGDLFNYFVIFFDRPFELGDFITVDDKKGTVEHIGIKTTRITSITGEQIAFSNSDLTKSRIHNFKRMNRRRILFSLGVLYETLPEKLEKVPLIIKDVITTSKGVTFDRAHFAKFGAYSLDFEVVFFVESSDYIQYMNIQQEINLKIFNAFAAEGIGFAYPTQTLLVSK